MTAIDSGMLLWPFRVSVDELGVDAETRALLTNSLLIKPLPFVRRVVFIATPHHGSYQALGILGSIGSWLVTLPGRFTKLSLQLVTLQTKGFLHGPLSGIPTSIDNMNPNNRFIRVLAEIPIAPGVAANSIVGVKGGGPPEAETAWYSSAHIDGANRRRLCTRDIRCRVIRKRSRK